MDDLGVVSFGRDDDCGYQEVIRGRYDWATSFPFSLFPWDNEFP